MTQTSHTTQQNVQNVLSLLDVNLNNAFSNNLSSLLQNQSTHLWQPSIDLIENTTSLFIYVTIPGVNPESLDIDFINNIVKIKGTREFPNINTTDMINRKREIIYGSFERKVVLPINVSQKESVTIDLKYGILIINISKNSENLNHFKLNSSDISINN